MSPEKKHIFLFYSKSIKNLYSEKYLYQFAKNQSMPNEEQKYHLGWLVLILIIGIAIGYIAFGSSGITGQATAAKQTTTATKIINPAYGSNFKEGETFTVLASIGCSGKKCNAVKSLITFNPTSGLRLPNNDATHSIGTMLEGETKLTSWLVSGASKGAYTVTVTTTSPSLSKSNDLISVNVYVPICNAHSDCGTSGYVGPNYCIGKAVYKDYVTYTCNLAGTVNAYCTSSTTPIIQEACAYACLNGACTTDPCAGVTCPVKCLNNRTMQINGICNNGICQYNYQN